MSEKNLPAGTKEITLSDGRKATIFPGKGKHSREAVRIANGDGSLYVPALMALLVEIDDKKVVMEDLDELPLKDYQALTAEFGDANF